MACGGCGGGVRKLRTIRTQKVTKKKAQKAQKAQKTASSKYALSSPTPQKKRAGLTRRQALIRNDKCPKCQNTIMLVNIAGRERKQCTNVNCRHIIR